MLFQEQIKYDEKLTDIGAQSYGTGPKCQQNAFPPGRTAAGKMLVERVYRPPDDIVNRLSELNLEVRD